jgi:hypothetical protein
LLGLAGAAAMVAFWAYREATAVPEFYAQAMARPKPSRPAKEAADELEREVLTVQNQLQQAEPWELVLKEDDINAWVATELPRKMPHLLPKEVEDPRIVIRDQRVYFACRHEKALGGVLSVVLEPRLTDVPNELALRVESVSVGRLPLPQAQYLDAVTKAAARSNLALRWEEHEGTAVAKVIVPDQYEDLRDRVVKIEALEVREGELIIRGTADRAEHHSP